MYGSLQDLPSPIGVKPALPKVPLLRPCLGEFFATMMFVFINCSCAISNGYLPAGSIEQPKVVILALGSGFTVTAMIFCFARISGGQFNPVVTMSFMLLGKEPLLRGVLLIVCQFVGGIAGASLMLLVYPKYGTAEFPLSLDGGRYGAHLLAPQTTLLQGYLMESTLTFMLVFVVLRVAVDKDTVGDSAAMVVGFTVSMLCMVGINVTCAGMNPARTLAAAVVGNIWTNQWIYWAGPVTGSLLATGVYATFFRTPEA